MGLYKTEPMERKRDDCVFKEEEEGEGICKAIITGECVPTSCAFFKTDKMQRESMMNISTRKWSPIVKG